MIVRTNNFNKWYNLFACDAVAGSFYISHSDLHSSKFGAARCSLSFLPLLLTLSCPYYCTLRLLLAAKAWGQRSKYSIILLRSPSGDSSAPRILPSTTTRIVFYPYGEGRHVYPRGQQRYFRGLCGFSTTVKYFGSCPCLWGRISTVWHPFFKKYKGSMAVEFWTVEGCVTSRFFPLALHLSSQFLTPFRAWLDLLTVQYPRGRHLNEGRSSDLGSVWEQPTISGCSVCDMDRLPPLRIETKFRYRPCAVFQWRPRTCVIIV